MIKKKDTSKPDSKYVKFLVKIIFVFIMIFGFSVQKIHSQTATPTPLPDGEETININSDLVQIEAIVKDKKGKIIRNLTVDDFELIENGKVRPIEFFSFVPINANGKNIEVSENISNGIKPQQVKRTMVFIVSNPSLKLTRYLIPALDPNINPVRVYPYHSYSMIGMDMSVKFLDKFINETLTGNDLVSIIDTEADLGTLSSFTNDREVLLAAARQMKSNFTEGKYSNYDLSLYIRNRQMDWDVGDLIRQNLNTLAIAESAIEELQKVPGRKLVFLLSRGMLGNSGLPGIDIVNQRLKSVIEKANRSKVTFYSLSLKTLGESSAESPPPPGEVQGSDNLRRLAEKTGGRAIVNTNDISVGFNEILEENNGYYQLAFSPDESSASKYYQVKINLKRPDLIAQYRSGVYQNGAVNLESDDRKIDIKEAVLKLLRTPFADDTVKIKLATGYRNVNKKQGKFTTLVTIDPKLFQPKMLEKKVREIKLDLGIQITEPDNKIVRQEVKRFSLKLSEESWRQTLKEGLVYQFDTLTEKTGTYSIKIAACINESNQCGNANSFVAAK